jgi:hypothetical protein
MSTWPEYPKIATVAPMPDHRLLVVFRNGAKRMYDLTSHLSLPAFAPLSNEALFKCARVDAGGYGVVWNDDIDLAESEIWLHGKPVDDPTTTKTIAEIEEDPIEFVRWARAQIMEDCGNDLNRFHERIKAGEAALRARGVKFADFSKEGAHAPEPSVLREDPPERP